MEGGIKDEKRKKKRGRISQDEPCPLNSQPGKIALPPFLKQRALIKTNAGRARTSNADNAYKTIKLGDTRDVQVLNRSLSCKWKAKASRKGGGKKKKEGKQKT